MKITPLEIRQKSFEKVFRGYDKDEVQAFLMSLSQEWERLIESRRDLELKLNASEKEVDKLREVESSLFKTLKTAEDTGANMIEQANRSAELHLREAHLKADSMLNEARQKARDIVENAQQQAQVLVDEMEGELKSLEQRYKQLEDHKEDLLSELSALSQSILQKVDKAKQSDKRQSVDQLMYKAKSVIHNMKTAKASVLTENQEIADESRKQEEDYYQDEDNTPIQEPENTVREEKPENTPKPEPKPEEKKQDKSGGSFFDEIE